MAGVEGAGQHLGHRLHRAVAIHQAVGAAVLPQQLSAATARHHRLGRAVGEQVDRHNGHEPTATGHSERGHECALGTEPEPVGSIFNVASAYEAAIVHQSCSTDGIPGVRAVGVARRCRCACVQRVPVDTAWVMVVDEEASRRVAESRLYSCLLNTTQ
jgi:hypothetical protein